MSGGVEHIGKKDVFWSYAAQIVSVGAGVILLPFIVNKMSAETVGIWNIFQTIATFVIMLDFGFNPSFSRTISYIFSGVKQLRKEGVEAEDVSEDIDYSLLAGTLQAMRKLYGWIAIILFVLLATAGTAYFYFLLQKYNGDQLDALIAWVLLIAINCYNLYTFYYEALLQGKGYIKRGQQIAILGQSAYLLTAVVLIYCGFGLTAIVSAQLISVLIRRVLSYRVFFTPQLREKLQQVEKQDANVILRTMFPNAAKMGLTNLGGLLVNRASIFAGSVYLALADVASFGITLQIVVMLSRCGMVFYYSHVPQVAKYRAEKNTLGLRKIFAQSTFALWGIFLLGSIVLVSCGDWALALIKSDTVLLSTGLLCVFLLTQLLECNHQIGAGFLTADNKIPFFIPSLLSGAATVFLLWLFMGVLHWGLWGMVLAPGLAQLTYQNWKWPSVVIKELWFEKEKK